MPPRRLGIVAAALGATGAALGGFPASVAAYELEISARTIGQGYQLRWLRPGEEDRLLNRRRFTQLVRLDVWNILAPAFDPDRPDAARRAPFELYVSTSLRLDHDFGDYQRGLIAYSNGGIAEEDPALSIVGELGENNRALDVDWAYLGGRGLWGAVDFKLGRQLELEPLDWYAFDGLALTGHGPLGLALTVRGGLENRSESLWGSPLREPDGTSGAECRKVELGGTTWTPTDECAQRRALLPLVGAALEWQPRYHTSAHLSYRRTMSRTSDDFPAAAPAWGLNQELVVASITTTPLPWFSAEAAVRYDLALPGAGEQHAGVRLGRGDHAVRLSVGRIAPSFDLDSIFVVFAASPYREGRLALDLWPRRGAWRGFAAADLRWFDDGSVTGGGSVGAAYRSGRSSARLELVHQDGSVGRRSGGDLSGRLRLRRGTELEGRITVVDLAGDDRNPDGATTVAAQAGTRFTFTEGIALHLLGEGNSSRFGDEVRVMGLLDLAFVPEI
jgi:hypothetical protein